MKKKAIILLFIISIVWGGGYATSQFAFDSGWPVFSVLFIRNFSGFLVMLFVAFKSRFWKNKKLWLYGLIAGILYYAGYALQLTGQNQTSVTECALLSCIVIVITPIASALLKRKPSNAAIIGCIIGLIGATVLTFPKNFNFNFGYALILLADIAYALHYVYIDNNLNKIKTDLVPLLCVQFLVMAVLSLISLPIYIHSGIANGQEFVFASTVETLKETILVNGVETPKYISAIGTAKGFLGCLYYAFLSGVIGVFVQAWSQKYVETSKVSLILSLESLWATIAGSIFFSDPITLQIIIGGAIMLISVALTQYFDIRNNRKVGVKNE